MQADIDALAQIHYAAVGQRTNEVLRVLTVISVVFLPLNLVAGLFGMNFVRLFLAQLDALRSHGRLTLKQVLSPDRLGS